MTEKEIQDFIETLGADGTDMVLLIMTADGRIILKTTHADYRRLGYALATLADEKERVSEMLNDLLKGMNDYCHEDDAKTVKVPIRPDTKYKS